MQSVLLEIDDLVDIEEFMEMIKKAYGTKKVKAIYQYDKSATVFYEIPEAALNPVYVQNFKMFTREELNER